MKRLGPELKMPTKMPKVKMPEPLVDLYWDLRDRRLLPLIALIAVGIVAAPFLLGGSDEPSPEPRTSATGLPAEPGDAGASSLTVVQATPGLRDYRKRLAHRSPTDPFKQRYTAPVLKGAKLNPMTTEGTTGSTTVTTGASTESESPPTESPGGSSPGSNSGGGAESDLTFYTFAIKVRISRSGGKNATGEEPQEPIVKERVLPQDALPGQKTPVVTYMGLSRRAANENKEKVLLLVSPDVKSIFGEMKCVSGDEACQLVEAEPGFPVTFIYGANEVHYTINVLKVEPVVTGHS